MFVQGVQIDLHLRRLVSKLAAGEKPKDATVVVNAAVREFIKRNTDLTINDEIPTREHVIETVLELKPKLIKFGVVSMSLFGSVSHGDAGVDSDIDLLINTVSDDGGDSTSYFLAGEAHPAHKVRMDVKALLEKRFDRTVQIVLHDALDEDDEFRVSVEALAVRIF